jgi:hypothetical protein
MRMLAGLALALAVSGQAVADPPSFGALPPQPVSRSWMGPADEMIFFLALDPAAVSGALPRGARFMTLQRMPPIIPASAAT